MGPSQSSAYLENEAEELESMTNSQFTDDSDRQLSTCSRVYF